MKEAVKIGLEFWDGKWAKPLDTDAAAVSDAFMMCGTFTDEEKVLFAEILLQGRYRVPLLKEGDDTADRISEIYRKFNANHAVEELIYSESQYVTMLWRYDFLTLFNAIPLQFAKQALRNIYTRLGIILLEEKDIMRILEKNFVYQVLFDLIAEHMGNNRYVFCDDPAGWNSFVFGAWFNMWKFFNVMGFNGYSPYTVCGDIGILSPKVCDWKFAALPKGALEAVDELNARARGRSFPTWQQNAFLGKLAKI